MCGIHEAVKKIQSPNHGDESIWDVCEECDIFIGEGQAFATKELLKMKTEEMENEHPRKEKKKQY